MPVIEREVDILEQEKRSVEKNIAVNLLEETDAVFSRTDGGFVSLTYTDSDGSVKTYPRVAVHRCFPFSDPTHYLSIREPENDGKEIGLIRDPEKLPPDAQKMLSEQMALRYFTPVILHIKKIKEEYGYSYWDVVTDRGVCRFTVRSGSGSVYPIGPNRYLINDLDGNRFEIPDLYRLSAKEIKQLDLYI